MFRINEGVVFILFPFQLFYSYLISFLLYLLSIFVIIVCVFLFILSLSFYFPLTSSNTLFILFFIMRHYVFSFLYLIFSLPSLFPVTLFPFSSSPLFLLVHFRLLSKTRSYPAICVTEYPEHFEGSYQVPPPF